MDLVIRYAELPGCDHDLVVESSRATDIDIPFSDVRDQVPNMASSELNLVS
jgi:hypothetical protein